MNGFKFIMIFLKLINERGNMLTTKEALGMRIKEFRERKNFTKDKLAELVGIDPKHLSRIENGRNYPSIETLEKLVQNLNITFEDLFQFSHQLERNELIVQITHILQILSDKNLKFIYKLLKEID